MPNDKTLAKGCQILNMSNGRTSTKGLCCYIYNIIDIMDIDIDR